MNLPVVIRSLSLALALTLAALALACGGGQGEEEQPRSEPGRAQSEADPIEYIVRFLAWSDASEYWFVDLASISADADLAPMLQNLTDTCDGWNENSSTVINLTIQDADFVVSLPAEGVFLGGIEDPEGVQETLAGSGYQRKETEAAVYWVNSSQKWQSVTFLPNGLVWVSGHDQTGYLEEQSENISYLGESWFEIDWERYLDILDSPLEVGSMDDVVSNIRDSLIFHFDGYQGAQLTFSKAGAQDVKQEWIRGFEDEESANRVEAAEVTAARDLPPGCSEPDWHRSSKKLALTLVCPIDSFD